VISNSAQVLFFTPSTSGAKEVNAFILQFCLLLVFGVYTFWTLFLMYKTCNNYLGENPLKILRRSTVFGGIGFLLKTVLHYYKYGWNIVDLLILVLFYYHLGMRIVAYTAVSGEPTLAPGVVGHPEQFMPFSEVMKPLLEGNAVLSFLAMFIWIKLFKYLSMSSYFRLLVRILEKCAAKLVVFSVLLLVIFFGFAVAFFVSNGTNNEYFSSISGSFLVLFFMLIDGYTVEESWFAPGKDQFMPIVFFCFIAVVYFVFLNIFIAVVLDVFATTEKIREEDKDKENPMGVYLWTWYNWMLGVSLVRNDTEENMRSEDLSISLAMLPGIVRKKWIEKKRKMQRVAQECFAGMELFPDEPGLAQPLLLSRGDELIDDALSCV